MSPIYNKRANPKRAKYEITGVQSTWFRIGQPYIYVLAVLVYSHIVRLPNQSKQPLPFPLISKFEYAVQEQFFKHIPLGSWSY